MKSINKKKIINDPVHGFIKIPSDLIYDLIEHPVFQRLRRIKQLGLTFYVYPGATHTRFQHTIGAVHLMEQAISHLKLKNIDISPEEEEAVLIAILLHDIGHGPFSHAMENSLIRGISHETLSKYLMSGLNKEFNGKLDLAIQIFNNQYPKKFLHQLVSSQLDMDRMDYLKRDSFFTGVVEGNIGTDRIIKMLDVNNDQLAIEAKGIYSIEKFLLARRLMYWQVYYHKAVISSEILLVKILNRIRYLEERGKKVYCTPTLEYFVQNTVNKEFLERNTSEVLNKFIRLDDTDIFVSAKQWIDHPDNVLRILADGIVNRKLPRVEISKKKFEKERIDHIHQNICKLKNIGAKDAEFLLSEQSLSNSAYSLIDNNINIVFNDGTMKDIAEVSDVLNISNMNQPSKKYVLCYPKDCG
ncbi:MAG: HD domain-containing protein [Bacteroidales bacterium]|nr:HD domain-containing protein [Bacteroidales bacterium]MBN2817717.1 HD domain-containing protein [Bacteroidales bacterium]